MEPVTKRDIEAARVGNLRALYREAYMAALGVVARHDSAQHGPVYPKDAVDFSRDVALETVRQWTSMQAELEKEIHHGHE